MAALSFPGSPANGATYTVGVQTWQWDATNLAWRLIAVPQVGVGAITSTMIADNTILDVDINSAANIALSKIQPVGASARQIHMQNGANVATSAFLTGDVTIPTTAGETVIGTNKVLRTMIQPYGVDLSTGTTGSVVAAATGSFTGFTSTAVGTGTNASSTGFIAAVTGMWAYTIRVTGGTTGSGCQPLTYFNQSGGSAAALIFNQAQGGSPVSLATGIVWLAANDFLEWKVINNTGSTQTFGATGNIRLITNG